ncbi:ImmA/IrrE family metallo-endopeptidase [Mesorhizobium sp. YIM 152430]|uniref:ImmA/IrrE family metallo-endopeptidase n=1 Tax=Mesorhizobium sp. YIM 152430 TaxID=3031761 RepID=UPI0023DB23D6|nr:ImmA/IrrE family metallo-endopeptidase [Mesorhizobium sp. YIM 152430]MDF1601575.1 ImmA/IrrE family metallo-endopeptidase [Mesorhizobium sp. YIM 152430]
MPISEAAIEDQAKFVRDRIGISRTCAPNMYWVLEQLSKNIARFSFRPEFASRMGDDEAIMNSDTHTLMVREAVLESAKAGHTRARFTIAHEIGHYFLGHDGERRRNPDKKIYIKSKEIIEEREADMFASYFLVPTEMALDCQNSEEVASRFEISTQAAEIAFQRVERAQRKVAGKERILPRGVIDLLQELKRQGRTLKSTISD